MLGSPLKDVETAIAMTQFWGQIAQKTVSLRAGGDQHYQTGKKTA